MLLRPTVLALALVVGAAATARAQSDEYPFRRFRMHIEPRPRISFDRFSFDRSFELKNRVEVRRKLAVEHAGAAGPCQGQPVGTGIRSPESPVRHAGSRPSARARAQAPGTGPLQGALRSLQVRTSDPDQAEFEIHLGLTVFGIKCPAVG